MTRTPTTSLTKLFRLRGRERLFQLLWGFVKWLAFVCTLLTVAMIADWWIDKSRETPMWLRTTLTVLQLIAYAIAAYYWIIRPWAIGPSLINLARRVEESIPEFDHRLVTSIQLTRAKAQTHGMSAELIGIVTEEAERISSKHDLMRLADSRRLKWSLALVAWPLGLLAFALLFFKPTLLLILLQRQMLADVDIPRNNQLRSVTPVLWASGDQVVIRYEVKGRIGAGDNGKVFVKVEGQPEVDYDLALEESADNERSIWSAKIPHSSVNFTYRGRIGDGRTKLPDEIRFEPRPNVTIHGAWAALPAYVPLKPDGSRFEIDFPNGDIKAYNGSRARVQIYVQKEVSEANLILYKRSDDGFSETEVERIPMDLKDAELQVDGSKHFPAEATFDLKTGPNMPSLIGYRVEATDTFGFVSRENPRRSLEVTEPDPVQVQFLKERFPLPGVSITEDDELEGLPIPLGGNIPIEFKFRSSIGVPEPKRGTQGILNAPARLMYRINDEPEKPYLLAEIAPSEESGPYDIQRASFANLAYMKKLFKESTGIEFTALPGADPMKELSRREGGGHFEFKTRTLTKTGPDGKEMALEIGDKIEFWIEVYDRHPNVNHPDPLRRHPIGRTDPRVKEIRSEAEVVQRALETINGEQRIRDLEKKQLGVFIKPKP